MGGCVGGWMGRRTDGYFLVRMVVQGKNVLVHVFGSLNHYSFSERYFGKKNKKQFYFRQFTPGE